MCHSHFLLSQQLWSSGQTFQPLVYSPGDSWPSVTSRQLLWCWPSDPFENFVFLRKSAAPGQLPWPVCSYNRDLLLIFQCLPGWALPISQGPAQITISLSRRRASQVVQWLKKKKNPPANAGDVRDAGSSLAWEDPWRRKWQPTPVFLSGKFHAQRSLVGYSPYGCKESGTT